jgi:hypothetical protein
MQYLWLTLKWLSHEALNLNLHNALQTTQCTTTTTLIVLHSYPFPRNRRCQTHGTDSPAALETRNGCKTCLVSLSLAWEPESRCTNVICPETPCTTCHMLSQWGVLPWQLYWATGQGRESRKALKCIIDIVTQHETMLSPNNVHGLKDHA